MRLLGTSYSVLIMGKGSIEYTTHASTIDNPFYYYDTVNDTEHSK